jgi:capsular polysaccharide biosynthesis protein
VRQLISWGHLVDSDDEGDTVGFGKFRADRDLRHDLEELLQRLGTAAPPVVLVLATEADAPEVRVVRAVFANSSVDVVLAQRARVAFSEGLRWRAPVHVLINLIPARTGQHIKVFPTAIGSVRSGGAYLVHRQAITPGRRDLVSWLRRLAAQATSPRNQMAGLSKEGKNLAKSVTGVVLGRRVVGVSVGDDHLIKARHENGTELVNRRSTTTTAVVLASLPPTTGATDHEVSSYGPAPRAAQPARVLDSPASYLRHYEGEIGLLEGALAITENVILPDSFRWYDAPRVTHPRLLDIGGDYARLRQPVPWDNAAELDGSYFHFDYVNSGHYGHLMTEGLSKLWGWPLAKAADPDLKLVFRIPRRHRPQRRDYPDFSLLRAFGVPEEDVVAVRGPVRVRSLVAATPMWHNHLPFHAHPDVARIWERLRAGFGRSPSDGVPRIFVTRRVGARACRNVEEVEAVFTAAGFRIVNPPGLSTAEQCEVFSAARVVAGFGGTGMFNLAYAHRVEDVIVLNQNSYDARNEHLFAAVHGARLHNFWSPADVPHPPDGWTRKAFRSTWAFDFDECGPPLRRLLRNLGSGAPS